MKISSLPKIFSIYFLFFSLFFYFLLRSDAKHKVFKTPNGHLINVYIISFNRLTALKKTIASLLKLLPVQNLVIIDNGSDYKPLLDYLYALIKNGSKVYFRKKLSNYYELNIISKIIEKHKRIKACDFYAVTDPDVDLDGVPQDFFDVNAEFLKSFSNITVVGPMLQIDDIPNDYAVREIVWYEQLQLFWKYEPKKAIILDKEVYYQDGYIDTTMGLFHGNFVHRAYQRGIRLYYPYDAKHLDWYITPHNTPEDQYYYMRTASKDITHWSWSAYISNEQFPAFKSKFAYNEQFSRFYYAVKNDTVDRRLKIVVTSLPTP